MEIWLDSCGFIYFFDTILVSSWSGCYRQSFGHLCQWQMSFSMVL